MNHETASPMNDAAIDRLVDGELSEAERHELLTRLEAEPGGAGWRRCALAFLEAQAWRDALGELARPSARPGDGGSGPAPALALEGEDTRRPAGGMDRPTVARLARAALVLVAFGVGWGARGLGRVPTPTSQPAAPILVQRSAPATPAPAPAARTRKPTGETRLAGASPRPVAEPSPSGTARGPVRTVGFVDLGDEGHPVRVPILAGPGLDEPWLMGQPSGVPEDLLRQWERQGYQVHQERRLVSLTLDDGRRVAIPVDDVQLQYVGQELY